MRNSRQGSIPSEIGGLIDELDDVQRRLRILEAPSGEALGNTIAKLQGLIEGIQAQLDQWAATRWTNAQITSEITAAVATRLTQDQVDQRIYAIVGSILAGNVSIGGELFVNGAVTMPNVYNTNIVGLGGSRVAVWVSGSGRMGNTA